MTTDRTCPRCGKALPADVPAGLALCPSCLLGAAIAEPAIPEDPLLNAAPPEHGELLSAAAAEATEPIAERHQDGSLPHISSRYRVLQRIAEGGMGVVYKAEQRSPVRRTVAIKLIKLGMDTRQVIARFESERQALAMLNHPNVAAVYDAGATNTGRPYFVMEWVAGEPITEFCDRHNYTTRQRLQLFIQACDAIQHAHQKAIIHRDIKPSNLLVTLDGDKPLVKVIDFGVAKATAHRLTEQTMFTEQGQLIGTPEYMSPEQAEMNALDVDTRTDIYSLGVVLYELLTGAVPFDSKTFREARLTGGIDEQAKRVWAAGGSGPAMTSSLETPRRSGRESASPTPAVACACLQSWATSSRPRNTRATAPRNSKIAADAPPEEPEAGADLPTVDEIRSMCGEDSAK